MRLKWLGVLGLASALLGGSPAAWADEPVFKLTIQNHRFDPEVLEVPAGVKVKLLVKNLDATPEEFESNELHREKVVPAGQEVPVFIGPLEPGTYPFFGDFNPKTAQGKIVAK
ncbi:MAG TPA: cupredoxin domain-containing protein [Stellaceae bacterium]|nr:cupredoxin domain-containing protein [Stellaceae bacterium]